MTSYGRNDAGWFSFRQSEAAPPLGKAPRRHFRLRERCTSGDSFKNSSPHVRVVRIAHSARFVDLATAFPATRPSAFDARSGRVLGAAVAHQRLSRCRNTAGRARYLLQSMTAGGYIIRQKKGVPLRRAGTVAVLAFPSAPSRFHIECRSLLPRPRNTR